MNKNMGTTDRLVRGTARRPGPPRAGLLVGWATVAGVIATVLAVVMLATAAVGFCPLYVPLHLHTDHAHKPAA